MKNKKKRKIHKDKKGREFIKETYFVGGKMKFHRVYVIDGIPADEFYEKNATDYDFYLNGDYELMSCNKDPENHNVESEYEFDESDESDATDDADDLPF